jgi:acetoin utilization deacetylase AcuC-like enzyme
VLEATDGFRPDFVLVSAGFDVMAGDPLGGMLLEPEDLHAMTRFLVERVATSCDGRVIALLEGGYDPVRLGVGAVAVIRALAGLPFG